MNPDYELLDCGDGRRLERFAETLVARPAPAAAFPPALSPAEWRRADLRFTREGGWEGTAPEGWLFRSGPAVLRLRPASRGQLGVFPEHARVCDRLDRLLSSSPPRESGTRALNLFAHTGLATLRLAARRDFAEIVHVDAAAAAVRQARENAAASDLMDAPVRWLVEDALTFLRRELRRRRRYDCILADPPAFGRSRKGGEWKLEKNLTELFAAMQELLMPEGVLCLTCHKEGWGVCDVRAMAVERFPEAGESDCFSLDLRTRDGGRTLPAGVACLCAGRR